MQTGLGYPAFSGYSKKVKRECQLRLFLKNIWYVTLWWVSSTKQNNSCQILCTTTDHPGYLWLITVAVSRQRPMSKQCDLYSGDIMIIVVKLREISYTQTILSKKKASYSVRTLTEPWQMCSLRALYLNGEDLIAFKVNLFKYNK